MKYQKVLFHPLHNKLGLMKEFVTALDKESAALNHQDFFPKPSEANVKAGIFTGPQIRKIMMYSEFLQKLLRKV